MAKLVAIGDSLTQGFQSLAINKTNLSFPAMIAEALGESVPDFRVPSFLSSGGLPFNVEWLARSLEQTYGANINTVEWLPALYTIVQKIDEVEEYWERGKGSQPVSDTLYHNLAVWGFKVADAYDLNAKMCADAIKNNTKDDWYRPPSDPMLRTAYRVLNPAQTSERMADTQIKVAKRIKAQDGEIENLIVWLGANNCLNTVVRLRIEESTDEPPDRNSSATLWKPSAFKKQYEKLAKQIKDIGANNVYVATVPHVTIPPVSRGVMKDRGRLPRSRKYFDYYSPFYVRDKEFDVDKHPHITAEEAEHVDGYIDEYNKIIQDHADDKGWKVMDACALLDGLAVRRNHGAPQYELPDVLNDLSISFFEINPGGSIKNGGLISLDGVHPTTCGYAIIAQEFINIMKEDNPNIRDIDFREIRSWDTLVSSPPLTLDDMFGMLKTLDKWFHISRMYM